MSSLLTQVLKSLSRIFIHGGDTHLSQMNHLEFRRQRCDPFWGMVAEYRAFWKSKYSIHIKLSREPFISLTIALIILQVKIANVEQAARTD